MLDEGRRLETMMGGPLAGLSEHLTLAREYALLGNYDTALIFFDGVVAQINKYAQHPFLHSFIHSFMIHSFIH